MAPRLLKPDVLEHVLNLQSVKDQNFDEIIISKLVFARAHYHFDQKIDF